MSPIQRVMSATWTSTESNTRAAVDGSDGVKRRLIYQPIAATGDRLVQLRPTTRWTPISRRWGVAGRLRWNVMSALHTRISMRVAFKSPLPVGGGEMYTISPGGPEHHHKPLSTDIIVVTGFFPRRRDIGLAGSRVPADALARHRPVSHAVEVGALGDAVTVSPLLDGRALRAADGLLQDPSAPKFCRANRTYPGFLIEPRDTKRHTAVRFGCAPDLA